jgi:hypothetical protein
MLHKTTHQKNTILYNLNSFKLNYLHILNTLSHKVNSQDQNNLLKDKPQDIAYLLKKNPLYIQDILTNFHTLYNLIDILNKFYLNHKGNIHLNTLQHTKKLTTNNLRNKMYTFLSKVTHKYNKIHYNLFRGNEK